MNLGADVINIKALQETYPYLAVLDRVTYCYGNTEMKLGQNVSHVIGPLEYFTNDEKGSPFAVRFSIRWFFSTCFKANMEQDFELAREVKFWFMNLYGRLEQVDPRSTSDARVHDILINTTVNSGKRYDVGVLWAQDFVLLPNSFFSALFN